MITNKLYNKLLKKSGDLIDLPRSTKRHFSFILDGNKIIAFGYNDGWKSHSLAQKYKWRFYARHSELDAILHFPYPPKFLAGCTMVNIRLNKAGKPAMSKPCHACQKLLADFSFKRVYYTDQKGELLKL